MEGTSIKLSLVSKLLAIANIGEPDIFTMVTSHIRSDRSTFYLTLRDVVLI